MKYAYNDKDVRAGQQMLRFADRNGSPVRDVKFNRDAQLSNVYFAAAHENGVVQVCTCPCCSITWIHSVKCNSNCFCFIYVCIQIWDIRKNSQPIQQIAAHHELVLTVDWHPSKNMLIATGSRDKTVNIYIYINVYGI